ncbi:TIGR03862 family flavoprotein [Xanthobacter sp. 126]|uniref:TIGR03862 family flavoprotein n=1 Tax=Xanthobacter sp. 126 TaxID=1131814 RepID=UPI00045E7E74|nr:TIGR03862 family flavoprotein [Xanthobacter sp. 126]
MNQPAPFIAIIGAGPAGLAAAEVLSVAGVQVSLYDRMPSAARKFLMAGRGGLNLTHSEAAEAFLARYGTAAERLAPALAAFPPQALRNWAAGLGEETFVGSSGRVFPESFKASPLLRAWLGRLAANGVTFHPRHEWQGFGTSGVLLFATPDGPAAVKADAVILALGGASWPRLGSDGGFVPVLRALGVRMNDFVPANMGVLVPWSEVFRQKFAGTPLKRIALTFNGATVKGEAMVSAAGLEGGALYALSAPLRRALADGPVTLHVDLRPDLDGAELARRLGGGRGSASLSTFLRKAAGLAPVAVGLIREATGPTRPDPATLARLVKALPLTITGHAGLERAISSAGGIAWDCIGPDFSLLGLPAHLPPVFVAGEMLDWEAPTGGYLLQAVIATGRAAGAGAEARLSR